jgi:hypothetical protein
MSNLRDSIYKLPDSAQSALQGFVTHPGRGVFLQILESVNAAIAISLREDSSIDSWDKVVKLRGQSDGMAKVATLLTRTIPEIFEKKDSGGR